MPARRAASRPDSRARLRASMISLPSGCGSGLVVMRAIFAQLRIPGGAFERPGLHLCLLALRDTSHYRSAVSTRRNPPKDPLDHEPEAVTYARVQAGPPKKPAPPGGGGVPPPLKQK